LKLSHSSRISNSKARLLSDLATSPWYSDITTDCCHIRDELCDEPKETGSDELTAWMRKVPTRRGKSAMSRMTNFSDLGRSAWFSRKRK
jgi:hypothetical protein